MTSPRATTGKDPLLKPVLITALVVDRPLCLPCVAKFADCSDAEVHATLNELKPLLATRSEPGSCRACGNDTTLYSIDRPNA